MKQGVGMKSFRRYGLLYFIAIFMSIHGDICTCNYCTVQLNLNLTFAWVYMLKLLEIFSEILISIMQAMYAHIMLHAI